MRNRHNQKVTLARSIKNPCPIKTATVHEPIGVGVKDLGGWNYKDLPEDHPERIRIEQMFAGIKRIPRSGPTITKWRDNQ